MQLTVWTGRYNNSADGLRAQWPDGGAARHMMRSPLARTRTNCREAVALHAVGAPGVDHGASPP